jgi:acyl-CoA thioesterase I
MISDFFQIPWFKILSSPRQTRHFARYSAQLPKNTPRAFRASPRPPGIVVACLGDSITHGHVSYPWVEVLNQKLGPSNYHFINAGINGNVAWRLNRRLPGIIECAPDIVVILIGTNDVMACFNARDGAHYKDSEQLPEIPTRDIFQRELRGILRKLEHVSKLAVSTLPPLGEIPDSAINQLVASFNQDIERISKEENRPVLHLHQHLMPLIKSRTRPPKRDYLSGPTNRFLPMMKAIADHHLRKLSWDESGSLQDLVLLTDHIHLGDRAGEILAHLVEEFVR